MNTMTQMFSLALLAVTMLPAFGLGVYGIYEEIKERRDR